MYGVSQEVSGLHRPTQAAPGPSCPSFSLVLSHVHSYFVCVLSYFNFSWTFLSEQCALFRSSYVAKWMVSTSPLLSTIFCQILSPAPPGTLGKEEREHKLLRVHGVNSWLQISVLKVFCLVLIVVCYNTVCILSYYNPSSVLGVLYRHAFVKLCKVSSCLTCFFQWFTV